MMSVAGRVLLLAIGGNTSLSTRARTQMDDPFLGQLYVMSIGDHLSDVEKAKLAPSLWRVSALMLPGADSRVCRQWVASKLIADLEEVDMWLHAAGVAWPPAPPRPKRIHSRMYRAPKPRQESQPGSADADHTRRQADQHGISSEELPPFELGELPPLDT
jgi:hypothetical protein